MGFRQVGNRLLHQQRQIQGGLIAIDVEQTQRLRHIGEHIREQAHETDPA